MIHSIRVRLTLIFISLTVLPLLSLGCLLTWQTFQAEKKHAVTMLQETVRRVGVEVGSFIRDVASDINVIVHVRGLTGISISEKKEILEELLSYHNEFDDLVLLDSTGQEIIRVNRTILSENMELANRSSDNAFLAPSTTGENYFGPVSFSKITGEPHMLIGVPFHDPATDGLLGVLVAKVRMKKIWELIANLQLYPGEDVYILDTQGRIMAHRNPSIVLRSTEVTGLRTGLDEISPHTGLNGTPVFRSSYRISLGDRGLDVVAEQSTTEALANAYKLLKIFVIITLIALAIAISFIVPVVANIVRPIQNLVQTARDITGGALSTRAQIVRKDEIGALADAFNTMTDKLRVSLEEQYQEVRERTHAQNLLQKELEINEALTSLSKALLTTSSIGDIADLVLDKAQKLTSSEHGFVSALDEKTGKNICYTLTKMMGDQCRIKNTQDTLAFPEISAGNSNTFLGHTPTAEKTFFTNNLPSSANSQRIPEGHIPVRRFLSVPVVVDEKIAGQISLANAPEDYTEKDAAVIERLGNLYALAISRLRNSQEKENLSNALRQAQKMEAMGTLAGGIAHDFNNILMPILGYSEMIQINASLDSDTAKDIAQVIKATHRASNLVKQILTFSRQKEHERQNVELHLIVKEAMKLLPASIPTTIDFKLQINGKGSTIIADATQLHQIIMNLCTNAYHAMQKTGGTLSVSLQKVVLPVGELSRKLELKQGDYLCLEISDTGVGMDQETINRIYEPYFSTKAEGRGTGLGLAVVHGIVKNHGGAINVSSEPGKGSTFTVYLPLSISPLTPRLQEDSELTKSLPRGDEHILIVDDEQSIIDLEMSLLKTLGYHVSATTESRQALEKFRSAPDSFDLLITDMTMPHLNGADLARAILTIRPKMPIILCTGYSDLITKEQSQTIGIADYLEKPIHNQIFAQTIRKLLGEK